MVEMSSHLVQDLHVEEEMPTKCGALATTREMEEILRTNPNCLRGVRLDRLRPDLMPGDRLLAELILYRNRLRGMICPAAESRCTAHW